jgi:hypothetical protein
VLSVLVLMRGAAGAARRRGIGWVLRGFGKEGVED